jgi:hypothetical protein
MNVRFWEFNNNCCWVKITLRPGQKITHRKSWFNGEGWSVREETWENCIHERQVACTLFSDGRDCDGRLTAVDQFVCSWEELKADRSTMDMDQGLRTSHREEIRRPNWKRLDSWQRDYYAEAMGY